MDSWCKNWQNKLWVSTWLFTKETCKQLLDNYVCIIRLIIFVYSAYVALKAGIKKSALYLLTNIHMYLVCEFSGSTINVMPCSNLPSVCQYKHSITVVYTNTVSSHSVYFFTKIWNNCIFLEWMGCKKFSSQYVIVFVVVDCLVCVVWCTKEIIVFFIFLEDTFKAELNQYINSIPINHYLI